LIDNKTENNYILPFLWMKGEQRDTIQTEISKIDECGIKAFVVESRTHPNFMKKEWFEDMSFILDIAKSKGMKVWVLDDAHFPTGYANGLLEKYPTRRKKYINFNSVDVWGYNDEVTLDIKAMCKPRKSWRDRKKSQEQVSEENRNMLISAVAYPLVEEDLIDEANVIDFTTEITEDYFTYKFPKGNWRIFITYITRVNGGNPEYINLIDRESVDTLIEAIYQPHYEHFKEEFGHTFAGFFSDEPGFGNTASFSKDEIIGKKLMALPWSDELKQCLTEQLGSNYITKLPFLWTGSIQSIETVDFRNNYMNHVTSLYAKNFSGKLGKWCEERNIEYIGHIIEDNNQHARLGTGAGHYFRAMEGQHMSGIDVIGGQILFGGEKYLRANSSKGDGEFYHYCLAKLGASSSVLDPIKQGRAMCELFGAYGWKLSIRDMKWIVDHLLVRGINHFVPHAFSMSNYPDGDCPPHFYAGGNNPLFSHFALLMKYTNRLCRLLNDGIPSIQVGILYHGEAEWAGKYMKMQKPARVLTQSQIDYLFVSNDMLKKDANVKDDAFTINNIGFRCLIVPYAQFITKELLSFIQSFTSGKIYFVEDFPERVIGYGEKIDFSKYNHCSVVALEDLPSHLKEEHLNEITLSTSFEKLAYTHYCKENYEVYAFHNEDEYKVFEGKVTVLEKNYVYEYDPFNDKWHSNQVDISADGSMDLKLSIEPHNLKVIVVADHELPVNLSDRVNMDNTHHIDISRNWNISLVRSCDYPTFVDFKFAEALSPISRSLPDFSGIIRYEKEIMLDEVINHAQIEIESVYDSVEIWINGVSIGKKINPPYCIDFSGLLVKGKNTIVAEVSTTADREVKKIEEQFIPMFEVMEPTGMFGKVCINYK
jgi:hypothetical protein